jgi:hypothetical protein
MRYAHAHRCDQCNHLGSEHTLAPEAADVRTGPYLCQHEMCDCEQPQDGFTPMDRRQYEAWKRTAR